MLKNAYTSSGFHFLIRLCHEAFFHTVSQHVCTHQQSDEQYTVSHVQNAN